MSCLFDGAKMSNGCLRHELLQTLYHVMHPPLQVPLMNLAQEAVHKRRCAKRSGTAPSAVSATEHARPSEQQTT